jgi:biotin operon repressor
MVPEVLITELSALELQVYLFIKSWTGNRFHQAACSDQYIANALKIGSRNTIRKALKELKRRGIVKQVEVEKKYFFNKKTGMPQKKTPMYRVYDFKWVKVFLNHYGYDELKKRSEVIKHKNPKMLSK